MSHQCVHCGKLHPDGSEAILKGCTCGSHFFYFIRKEYLDKIKSEEIQEKIEEIESYDKKKIERDVRQIIGISEKEDIPVILDLESIRVLGAGKFEIDVVNLFNRKRPLIYKLEEGKYIIDLSSMIKVNAEERKNIEL